MVDKIKEELYLKMITKIKMNLNILEYYVKIEKIAIKVINVNFPITIENKLYILIISVLN